MTGAKIVCELGQFFVKFDPEALRVSQGLFLILPSDLAGCTKAN